VARALFKFALVPVTWTMTVTVPRTARKHRSLRPLMVALARLPTQLANCRCEPCQWVTNLLWGRECASHGHTGASHGGGTATLAP
jgi:hypothetical protein